MMFWKTVWLRQRKIPLVESKIHTKLTECVTHLGLFRRWAEKFEYECTTICNHVGYNKNEMKQCFGCKTWYHPICIFTEKENDENSKPIEYYQQLTKKDKWYCDLKGKCIFRRGGEFIKIYEENLTV